MFSSELQALSLASSLLLRGREPSLEFLELSLFLKCLIINRTLTFVLVHIDRYIFRFEPSFASVGL